jgi:hypothetical protein
MEGGSMLRAGLVLAAALVFSPAARPATITFVVPLDGQQEVDAGGNPGQGDPDGAGTATLMIDDATNTISWSISVQNIDSVILAHIHVGNAGTNGAPVVDFNGQLTGSGLFDADLAAVLANPTGYYVNVHTTAFQAGAIRGQLGEPVPEPASIALLLASAAALGWGRRGRA